MHPKMPDGFDTGGHYWSERQKQQTGIPSYSAVDRSKTGGANPVPAEPSRRNAARPQDALTNEEGR